ncbi:hypothetical protein BKA65DRAFT_542978 [Rhexocercosporidium sp. MPI-PUGE-AT-0058]|nr:hypothetical protein BKA65DRAFT_542978 [Rhexocercosporidium sp. MPI-PUGE-AT-0058]
MTHYDPPPVRAYRTRTYGPFSDPPLRSTAFFYPQEPQYADSYHRGRARSPHRSTVRMPRIYRVCPERDTYIHSPTRSPSPPPVFHPERNSCYDTPYSHFQWEPWSKTPDSPPLRAQDTYFPPSPLSTDSSPEVYTYDDEEPDRIPIAPMPWNGNSSSVSKEELINFLVDQGIHPKVATAHVGREFAARAPQHVAGRAEAGVAGAQAPGKEMPEAREESDEEKSTNPSPEPSRHAPPPQAQRRARRRSPPPAAYRSPSPVSSSHHRSSSSSRYRAASPPRSYGTFVTPPHTPSPRQEGVRRHRSQRGTGTESREERRERKESRRPPRAPSPPPAASRAEAGRERRDFFRRG